MGILEDGRHHQNMRERTDLNTTKRHPGPRYQPPRTHLERRGLSLLTDSSWIFPVFRLSAVDGSLRGRVHNPRE